ncbi:MAG: DsbA family protein [Thermoplasmata archaeon]|nr:MAG: DsbA family protein [Thermoplasmata archaeon]
MSNEADDSAKKSLAAQRWDQVIPRLVEYARARIRIRIWAGRKDGPLPGGKEAEDMVYEAIEKTLDGRRAWDARAHPDLEAYLRDVIESDLNHLAVGFENRRFLPASQVGFTMIDDEPVPLVERVPSPVPGPQADLELDDERREALAFRDAFIQSLGDEPELAVVVRHIIEGVERPAELAEKAGVPAKDIYNMRKRLQRRLLEFYGKWSQTLEEMGINPHYIDMVRENVYRMAKELDLMLKPPPKVSNSKMALLLCEYVKDLEKFNEYHTEVFKAYWQDGKDIGNLDVLLNIIEKLGLDPEEARAFLDNERTSEKMAEFLLEARAFGVDGVPTFIIGSIIIEGAQPYEVIKKAVEQVRC